MAFRIELSKDYELIRRIATHRLVYPFISDDFSPKADDYKPIESEQIHYVVIWDETELMGMFVLVPENHVCAKVHTCLLPAAYGERARQCAKEAIEWAWTNTAYARIVTDIPDNNRRALKFSHDVGFQVYGVNPKSFMKSGILRDQILMGVSKCL